MKQVLRVSLLAVALLIGVTANAQMQFGVKAGVNMSNFTGDVEDNKAKIGFQGGVTMDYGFSENMGIQTGLMFAIKGAKMEDKEADEKVTLTANPMYLQVPIHFAYKLPVTESSKVIFHAGPYVAYGIGGKYSLSFENKPQSDQDEIKADFGDPNFFDSEKKGGHKAFDYGLGGGVGMEFGKIGVDLSVDYGLGNMARGKNEDNKDLKLGNFNAYLSVGYKF